MTRRLKFLFASAVFALLSACGGGGSSDSPRSISTGTDSGSSNNGSSDNQGEGGVTPPSSGDTGSTPPGGNTDSGSAPPSGGSNDGGSSPPTADSTSFAATVTQAPEDTSILSGTIRLEVQGGNIRNVELLPENGYAPRLAPFFVSDDGTLAYLDLDTRVIPNGGIKLRISAFDAPTGAAGAREVIAMPTRTWLIRNPEQPLGIPEARAISCLGMGYGYTSVDDSQPVVCIQWTPLSPPVPPEQCTTGFATPYVRPGDSLPVHRNGNLMSKLYCEPRAYGGVVNVGCECYPAISD